MSRTQATTAFRIVAAETIERAGEAVVAAEERRKTQRRAFVQPAGLFHPDGKRICACIMRDISDVGARLKIAQPNEIPDEFILTLTKSGSVSRRCRLVWRRDDEVGVHFSRA